MRYPAAEGSRHQSCMGIMLRMLLTWIVFTISLYSTSCQITVQKNFYAHATVWHICCEYELPVNAKSLQILMTFDVDLWPWTIFVFWIRTLSMSWKLLVSFWCSFTH